MGLLWGAKAPVVARFVPASGWKLAYTHNERRQSSLKATQCCGSAMSPKDRGGVKVMGEGDSPIKDLRDIRDL